MEATDPRRLTSRHRRARYNACVPPSLQTVLTNQRASLRALVEREASGVLAFESADDVVQGITMRALSARFEYRDEASTVAFVRVLARHYIADRHDYWCALRRGSGKVLRLTWSDSKTASSPVPPQSSPGPATFAERRELIALATKALHTLPDRDRQLVTWMSQGIDLDEQAERLELSYAACQRAGHRALDRFRIAFELLVTSTREA